MRTDPRIYAVFAQILKTHKLTASIDRVCLKPPNKNADANNNRPPLHVDLNYWDAELTRPAFQAGVCLEDCLPGGGGFYW